MIVVSLINVVFGFFQLLLLARVIFSWVRVSPYHPVWGPVQRFVHELTEPFVAPIRRIMPAMGMIDLSIFIVWLLAGFVQSILIQLVV